MFSRRPVLYKRLNTNLDIPVIERYGGSGCPQPAQRPLAEDGPGGVALEDLLSGVADFFDAAAQGLTPVNCRNHLDDLPQDMDVVRVDRVERKVRQPHRYLNTIQ